MKKSKQILEHIKKEKERTKERLKKAESQNEVIRLKSMIECYEFVIHVIDIVRKDRRKDYGNDSDK